MFLSDRDLLLAIESRTLIVAPKPEATAIDTTGIDLHLDRLQEAGIWDVEKYAEVAKEDGHKPYLRIGSFNYRKFAPKYIVPVPEDPAPANLVFRDGNEIVLRPFGFVLWQTKETVGTPLDDARFICFIDGKSSRARTGLLIHLTAPTIHANWSGQVTLELCNLGPFDIALKEDDAVAQLTVATITSPPLKAKQTQSIANQQQHITGQAG